MSLRRLGCMMSGMLLVPMRQMGMVAGFFMVSRLVVFCSLMVVAGSVLVVLGSLSMMICEVFRHAVFSLCNDDVRRTVPPRFCECIKSALRLS